ncbi:MAG: hypothetical protein JO235_22210 [Chroococcidiopsidaceae cyanobacterium CP_BM_RX_35]|nr:hypothetical protein [Chroococcidiopsidaceae cyanobacterium CP_BM_RX_35]
MSPCETFFAFGFVSTLAVVLLASWFRFLPTLIALYQVITYNWPQPHQEKYDLDQLKFYF